MDNSFPKSSRFDMVRRLGIGGMGVVYQAFDKEYNAEVALKVMRFAGDGEYVQRFKNEFRYLQGVRHPNLVRYLELVQEEGLWFFTMELVRGVDFLEWVRPGLVEGSLEKFASADTVILAEGEVSQPEEPALTEAVLDEERLQDAFRQLIDGLDYLHSLDRLHRDIKPANILVTDEGRVVLLDFGLATYKGEIASGEVLGTPNYMAPETMGSSAVGPASDWYSVGVTLYEVLTLHRPYKGTVPKIFDQKHKGPPSFPEKSISTTVAPWQKLSTLLMAPDPALRPRGEDLLNLLGIERRQRRRRSSQTRTRAPLLGRQAELKTLHAAYEQSCAGHGQIVFVYGESGLGKSEVIREFGHQVEGEALVFFGRCYEREAVPFKAVDGVIDAVASHLAGQTADDLCSLVPKGANVLVQAFPVLKQVRDFGSLSGKFEHDPSSQLRLRVFEALRDLLNKIVAHKPVVLLIDDLQWADQDSWDLLAALTAPPNAPNILLVATIRTALEGDHEPTQERRLGGSNNVVEIDLAPLSQDAACRLVERLANELNLTDIVPAAIAQEAGCHPLFIDVLLRYRYTQGRKGGVSLTEALKRHIEELNDTDRRVLELVSLAGRPLTRAAAARAAQLPLADLRQSIDALQAEKLLRGDGVRNTDTIEPYHSRIREVAASLPPNALAASYRCLAETFEAEKNPDPEALASFWEGAADHRRAMDYTEAAAERATGALAYERSADLYLEAIRLQEESDVPAGDLWEKLAGALVKAGRGEEAATAYFTAAGEGSSASSLELRRLGAEQLLRCGQIDEGIVALRPVLAAYDLKMPETRGQALRRFLLGRLRLRARLRGFRFTEVAEAACKAEDLAQLDVLWSACIGLINIDQLRGLGFHNTHLLLALNVGERSRVARALAFEASVLAAIGGGKDRIDELLDDADRLAETIVDPYAKAWNTSSRALVAHLQGRWTEAKRLSQEALEQFTKDCLGVAWEIETMQLLIGWERLFLGEVTDAVRQTPILRDEAAERGDLYGEIGTASGMPNLVWLMQDLPDEAREKTANAIRRWSQKGFHFQHMLDLFAQAQVDLYQGDGQGARDRVETAWPKITSSGLLQVQLNRVLMHDLRARTAVFALQNGASAQTHRLVVKCCKVLRRESCAWSPALAALLDAQLLFLDQDSGAKTAYLRAAESLRQCGMSLHAWASESAARNLNGEPLKVDPAFADIVRPERIVRLLVPAFVPVVSGT